MIGVLNDGRQVAGLSLFDSTSAARVALEADGHTIVELGPGSLLAPPVLQTVDIVWLPLIETDQTYTDQDRTNLTLYAFSGGRIVWIGDADVYNAADDSFLSALGLSKLAGNFAAPLAPAVVDHPILTGPHGPIATIGTNASYGVFDGGSEVTAVFTGDPGPGVVVGLMGPGSGYAGAGRVALICDATMFGQLLLQDDHRALLRNVVAWIEAAPGYTPSGASVAAGPFAGACDACAAVSLVFSAVAVTGESSLTSLGGGRCGVGGVPDAALPADFVGYAFDLLSTATLDAGGTIQIAVSYDSAVLASLGITDEAALKLYRYDPTAGASADITTLVDTGAKTVTGLASSAGTFLFGSAVPAVDCNNNGLADVCEIDAGSSAPGGPFYCTVSCDPDCNDNGIPDSCDIAGGQSQDCNANGVPDTCESALLLTLVADPPEGGSVTPSGAASYPVCSTVPIEATAAAGYCFLDWSVSSGAAPADAGAPQTSVLVDEAKTVTARFVAIITQQPTAVDLCDGQSAVFSLQVDSGLSSQAVYQWRRNGQDLADGGAVSGAATAVLTIDPAGSADAGTYTCLVSLPCGTTTSLPAALIVGAPPQITSDPTGLLACPGDDVQLTMTATGTGLAYQWQFDGGGGFADLTDTPGLSGSATATLSLQGVSADDQGAYRCVVSGACGGPVTSASASLAVGQGPAITAEPADSAACPGDTVSFAVTATGTSLQYQWRWDAGAGPQDLVDDALITGAETDTLTIQDVDAARAGVYSCVVSGTCPGPVLSAGATLTIGQPPQVLGHPADQTQCPGDSVLFVAQATGTALSYQWQSDNGSGFADLTDDADLDGALTDRLSIANLTPARVGVYRCVISGDCGTPVATDPAVLVLEDVVTLDAQPADVVVCPGGVATFHVIASGTAPSYQWQFNGGAAFENLTDGGTISGASSDTLSIIHVDASAAGLYRCVVNGTCGPAWTSDAAQLSLGPGVCDCNGNGTPDADDIAAGTSVDCDGNGVPDSCDIDSGASEDCNGNGVPDACDIDSGAGTDCDGNGVPDSCELAGGDCNGDGIPDICQLADDDCNGNGTLDACEPPYVADAGPDLILCAGQVSLPLGGATVAAGSSPPYAYQWRVLSGPPGGGEVLSETEERARFRATIPGDYEIELQVSDASDPPCVVTDVLAASVYSLTVDAGADLTLCADATSAALTPVVTGGLQPLVYEWTIEPGGPSTDPAQFTGNGAASLDPTFSPQAPGDYTLRLTVTDANDVACVVSDTLQVHAVAMTAAVPDDFAMCVSGVSAPLDVVLTSPGTPPHTYAWSIEDGSPNLALSQFGGVGPAGSNPTFAPLAVGTYTLRVTVTDASDPPCEVSETVQVAAGTLTVDAGPSLAQCAGGAGVRLSPSVDGGFGDLIYSWTVEPGSPSVDPAQFVDPHAFAAEPLFVPAALGSYTLRLTVTDSGTPPCSASDTVVIQATSMTVDAGEDFITRAFEPSRPLGALPLVGGGDPPFVYEWRVLAGPDLDPGQFSATDAARPTFRPSGVGTYALEVRVT
ncbi:MAG: immunoglobulin domain-containing protein, partial [Phycisphaerae bacterium]